VRQRERTLSRSDSGPQGEVREARRVILPSDVEGSYHGMMKSCECARNYWDVAKW